MQALLLLNKTRCQTKSLQGCWITARRGQGWGLCSPGLVPLWSYKSCCKLNEVSVEGKYPLNDSKGTQSNRCWNELHRQTTQSLTLKVTLITSFTAKYKWLNKRCFKPLKDGCSNSAKLQCWGNNSATALAHLELINSQCLVTSCCWLCLWIPPAQNALLVMKWGSWKYVFHSAKSVFSKCSS